MGDAAAAAEFGTAVDMKSEEEMMVMEGMSGEGTDDAEDMDEKAAGGKGKKKAGKKNKRKGGKKGGKKGKKPAKKGGKKGGKRGGKKGGKKGAKKN